MPLIPSIKVSRLRNTGKLSLLLVWVPIPNTLFSDFSGSESEEHFDEDTRNCMVEMDDSQSTYEKSQLLKDEGNRLFRAQAYWQVITKCYKALQCLCEDRGMVEAAHEDLLLALKFDANNDEVKQELLKVKQMRKPTCANSPMGRKENGIGFPIELPSNSVGAKNLGNSSHLVCSP
ncbi:hypothetical protein Cgig2_000697 [Carnegiea gigantea]|uniref:Uncharacterized protein n=1 Tax=Carnegiea gigantea TaxID=171969 RepID=A0A9Q1KC72_9CARY|nr:hypothetical protein Cgig2_000697 [Carnegiea gigantea]